MSVLFFIPLLIQFFKYAAITYICRWQFHWLKIENVLTPFFIVKDQNQILVIYNYFNMNQQHNRLSEIQENSKARGSNSTNHTQNEERDSNSTLRFSDVIPQQIRFYRSGYFVDNTKHTVSKKLNRSAVNWIQTQCWTKNIDIQSNFLAVTLYYCYAHNKAFQKSQLQSILITCLYVASKFYGAPLNSIQAALSLVSKQYQPSTIIKIQSQILQLIEFDLFFQNIHHVVQQSDYSESDYNKICFFMELLLLKDQTVLFSEQKLDQLNVLVFNKISKLPQQISLLLKMPQAQVLVNKYRTIIQIDKFLPNY